MAITYTTHITAVRVASQEDLEDVVKEVDVTVTGANGAVTFTLPTTVAMGPADPEAFTPFSDLTEAQLLAWVEANPSLEPVQAHVAYVVAKEVERAALTPKPLPWAPAPPTIEPPIPAEEV